MNSIHEAILWGLLTLNGGAPVAWHDAGGEWHTVNRFNNSYAWGHIDRGLDYKTYRDGEITWRKVKYYKSAFTPFEPWIRVESMHNSRGAMISWEDSE